MKNTTGVAEKVAENIKKMLFSGEIARGTKLPGETALAKKLGVGRSSVREALRLLSASGYVELKPNRGAFALVTSEDELPSARSWLKLNHEKVEELLSVRSCIEPFACELCAKNITEAGLSALKKQLDGFEAALDSEDWELLSKYDLDFHRTILDESHNRYLIEMYRPLLEGFMQYSRRSLEATYSQSNTLSEHKAVYTAILERSPEEARAAMALHITIAKRRVKIR